MQEPVGDDDGERAGLGEEHGQVPARLEAVEAANLELRHVGTERGGGVHLRCHLPGYPRGQ